MNAWEKQAVNAYLECAFFCGTVLDNGDDDNPDIADFDPSDLDPSDRGALCADGLSAIRALPVNREDFDPASVGHDAWFTREGHGTGFWDRGDTHYPKAFRDAATQACERIGGCGYFYVEGETLRWERG